MYGSNSRAYSHDPDTYSTTYTKNCSSVSLNTLLTIPEHKKIQIYLILLRCEYITMSLCKFTSYKSLASLEKRNTRVLHDQAKARKLKTLKNALHPVQDFLDFSIMFTSLHIVKWLQGAWVGCWVQQGHSGGWRNVKNEWTVESGHLFTKKLFCH